MSDLVPRKENEGNELCILRLFIDFPPLKAGLAACSGGQGEVGRRQSVRRGLFAAFTRVLKVVKNERRR